MKSLTLLFVLMVPLNAFSQGGGPCYYFYCDTQGCDPWDNSWDLQSCPTACNNDPNDPLSDACAGVIEWFADQGPDWDYTNGVSSGFQFGKTSYHNAISNIDIYNLCMEEGSCACDWIYNASTDEFYVGCVRSLEHEWTDYTVRIDPTWVCDPEFWDPNYGAGDDDGYGEEQ
ncbi:hypothetical protein [Rubripirellula reticaptiva]|uniref:Uncharacterized protein n=1 Tax=Rubripirellula reticaptiva TaxID=2528013 RepID=A0A5C6EEP8_9BACT|nr:hypothetical protein [Rubripirellula reticaptiva]TWU47140.1 hypothetical protein Poly59_61150 [Rubripirellula reticaptiva]